MPWIIGGAGVVASLLGGSSAASAQRDANRTNLQSAREQMAFQERMSGSEYQRSKADLEKAGFNPMLSFMKGGGASTPGGAMATVQPVTGMAEGLKGAGASAMQAATLQNLKAQNELIRAQTMNVDADTGVKQNSAFSESQRWANIELEAKKLEAEIANLGIDANTKNLTKEQMEQMNPLLQEAQKIQNGLQAAGISEAEARSKMFEKFPGLKWLFILLNKGGK